jgi:succinate dehydrogenase / fumarate reductase, iron-sulfur subunit
MPDTVSFKIFRFDPQSGAPARFDTFQLPKHPGQNVLEALFEILEFQDGSLAFRYSCRGAVCGSCAMHINGKYRLACQTQVTALGDVITIQPLQHFPIIKDLVVDQEGFFAKHAAVQPYLKPDEAPPEKERLQTAEQRARVDDGANCILCACCQASCPMTFSDAEYLGPAILLQVDRFYQDSREVAKDARLDSVDGEHGVWRCHTVFNCTEVCPKGLHPAGGISHLKQGLVARCILGPFRHSK